MALCLHPDKMLPFLTGFQDFPFLCCILNTRRIRITRNASIHIPEKQFHMLHYDGLYAKGRTSYPAFIRQISEPVKTIRKTLFK